MRLFILSTVLSLLGGVLSPGMLAAETCVEWVAKAVSVQGNVEVRRAGKAPWTQVQWHDTFCHGDIIGVRERSRLAIVAQNGSNYRLDENTTITITQPEPKQTFLLNLREGAAYFFSRLPRSLQVITPFANAGVEGTEFFVKVEGDQTFLSVFEGQVAATNPMGSLTLASGQSAIVKAGQAPALHVVVRPRDAVQWALYYPPIIDFRPADFANGAETDWRAMVRRSIQFYRDGNLPMAFASIAGAPEDIRDPRFFTYRAALLLSVGRVDEAKADIDRALALAPRYSPAVAVRSVIAVAQNDKSEALRLARTAVELDPTSAAARVALSYAQQADFDLNGALASLQEAVKRAPENALAWARLAELWLSFGELRRALKASNQAVKLQPALARTQTVLGFSYLAQIKTHEAKQAFEKAIQMDQADPLPRLGLGLAKIRASGLAPGREDIEIAVSLDPNNSLMRSYLGKAYFEEKRTGLDEREYGVAKELDPQDPTPWFYDAIAKQTRNRPVEALHDLQHAIDLNDNRAVYRSRLLLDADLAARSASLGRIYSDLGFQQLALVEGWKSVNTDPTNFSAHRFLADSYAVLPRHEIARVSELLQSQLLQPINITPIQPRLAESNLFLISAGGPGAASFNEFNPIFNRDRLAVQGGGLIGENNTYSGEGVLSGIYKNVSFSLGAFHYETDGWRTRAFQDDNIANAFLQFALSPSTSLQAEYRYRDVERGDLQQRFFPEDFSTDTNISNESHTIRLGLRHEFSPSSILLTSFIYRREDFRIRDNAPPGGPLIGLRFTDQEEPNVDNFDIELRYLHRTKYFNFTIGFGYAQVLGKDTAREGIDAPPPPDGPGPFERELLPISIDTKHISSYLYTYINLLRNVTFTVGGSFEYVDASEDFIPGGGDHQFNPKIGVTWTPLPNTTVRGAVFRTLKKTLITDQTLEPTQVAGFNQFFDDLSATDAWRYGVAIDQKFSNSIFGGVEFAARDFDFPFVITLTDGSTALSSIDGHERMVRAYAFWTPITRLALRAEYMYERFKNDLSINGKFPLKLTTHRVPIGINYIDPSGLSVALGATYWDQDGRFFRISNFETETGNDQFWTVDMSINYRLPKRHGFVTLGVTNLFDKEFKYFNVDFDNPTVQPTRMVFGRVAIAFP